MILRKCFPLNLHIKDINRISPPKNYSLVNKNIYTITEETQKFVNIIH